MISHFLSAVDIIISRGVRSLLGPLWNPGVFIRSNKCAPKVPIMKSWLARNGARFNVSDTVCGCYVECTIITAVR